MHNLLDPFSFFQAGVARELSPTVLPFSLSSVPTPRVPGEGNGRFPIGQLRDRCHEVLSELHRSCKLLVCSVFGLARRKADGRRGNKREKSARVVSPHVKRQRATNASVALTREFYDAQSRCSTAAVSQSAGNRQDTRETKHDRLTIETCIDSLITRETSRYNSNSQCSRQAFVVASRLSESAQIRNSQFDERGVARSRELRKALFASFHSLPAKRKKHEAWKLTKNGGKPLGICCLPLMN